ncbi:MAG: FMN-binding protein [Clostridia bacterium]|nr:FMN-binding protein [Clostridia bacterium]
MKRLIKIGLIIFTLGILVVGGAFFYLTRGLETGSSLEVGGVNLSALNDGVYQGKYEAGRWSNEVKVTVKDHKITKVDVVKDVTFPKPEWTKNVLNKVIEKQTTNVDIVSGATVTSKAYLKAIENALNK